MNTNFQQFLNEIQIHLNKSDIKSDILSLLTLGTDASFYRYLPKLVVKTRNVLQVQNIIKAASKYNVALTFRAAGTSLSGQTITDSVIILVGGENWKNIEITNNGNLICMQPGVTGLEANNALKKFAKKIGPDPASINSAMIGGIVANNASGMTSGVLYNSYNLITDMQLIFPDGTFLDTSDSYSIEQFRKNKVDFLNQLVQLRQTLLSNPELKHKIIEKYKIKNTTGYGINAFIDFEDPIDIITHLIPGSEGTLAFIAKVTMKTVPDFPFKASGLLLFSSLQNACNAAVEMNKTGVSAIELIDRKALKSVEKQEGIPSYIAGLPDEATALLVEIASETSEGRDVHIMQISNLLNNENLLQNVKFTSNPKEIAALWKVRKGIFPSVGANRKAGTTVVIEDVAFKLELLPKAIPELRTILDKYNYTDAVIYGHANDGNVHFIFSVDFNSEQAIDNYRLFMNEIAEMVVHKYNGSLKAEHGTGRNMAPFVAYEWGTDLYQIMVKTKQLFDPDNVFNPGVLINEDSNIHLKNFKPVPQSNPIIDPCIECGFCEINCLTNEHSLSARQRIIAFRELTLIQKSGSLKPIDKQLLKAFDEKGIKTCAADGLCATSCPVGIDTGKLIKDIKNQRNLLKKNRIALFAANNMPFVIKFIQMLLALVSVVHKIAGTKGLTFLSKLATKITFGQLPLWHKSLPKQSGKLKPATIKNPHKQVVYFPSCINRAMGNAMNSEQPETTTDVIVAVLERAGYEIIYPENMNKLCCGTPWESKGYFNIANQKSDELELMLLKASLNGKIPILCDTSPCLYRMRRVMNPCLQMFEPVEFALDFVVKDLKIVKKKEKIALHSTCTTTKMGLKDKLLNLGNICAEQVIIPEKTGCCGFAGDKGFTQPDINNWALRNLKPEITGCQTGYSNSRTCEIGLSNSSGIEYKSVFNLLFEVSSGQKI